MATLQNLGSAKIIQFPLQRRLELAGIRGVSTVPTVSEQPVVISDSWYHEAAIREERTRKQ